MGMDVLQIQATVGVHDDKGLTSSQQDSGAAETVVRPELARSLTHSLTHYVKDSRSYWLASKRARARAPYHQINQVAYSPHSNYYPHPDD